MKRFLLIFAASLAITYSFISRANSATQLIPVVPEEITHDAQGQKISVSGQLPNPCTATVLPVLLGIDASTIVISFVGEVDSALCVGSVGSYYDLDVTHEDIKNEVFNLGLNPEAKYSVVTSAGDEIAQIDLSQVTEWAEKDFQPMPRIIFPAQPAASLVQISTATK